MITHSLAIVTVMMALISGLLGKRERGREREERERREREREREREERERERVPHLPGFTTLAHELAISQ